MGLESWTYLDGVAGWPDTGLGTLVYGELKDSGNAGFGVNNSGADRHFIIDYGEEEVFLLDLLGWSFWQSNALKRRLPDQHPLFTNFYATSATLEPWGAPAKNPDIPFIKKKFWKVSAQYEAVDYAVLADADVTSETQRYCSFKYGFQTQFLTTTSFFQFEASRNKIGTQPAVRTAQMQLQLTWHNVPSLDAEPFKIPVESKIKALQGKVNSDTFLGFPAGTVQFVGADPQFAKPRVSSTVGDPGLYSWDITYTFLIKDEGESPLYAPERIGWQHSYDLKENRWDRVRSIVGNELPFQTGAFAGLFTIA